MRDSVISPRCRGMEAHEPTAGGMNPPLQSSGRRYCFTANHYREAAGAALRRSLFVRRCHPSVILRRDALCRGEEFRRGNYHVGAFSPRQDSSLRKQRSAQNDNVELLRRARVPLNSDVRGEL